MYDVIGSVWQYFMDNYTLNGSKYSGQNAAYNLGYTGLLVAEGTFTDKFF